MERATTTPSASTTHRHEPAPSSTRPRSSSAHQSGQIAGVGELRVTVTEPGRVTCVPTTHACSERSYLLDVFYPSRTASSTIVADAPVASVGGPYPLIVFAAGFDEDPSAYVPLIEAWVRAGYVVAAPRFPLSSAWALATYGVDLHDAAIADAFESDMLNEPGDLSAAIGEMDVLARSGVLAGRVATDDVALAGQSDGGDVVLASADNTCCAIPGVRAVAVLSGAVFSPFGGSFFGSSVPMLVVQGSADTVNPPSASQAIYADAQAPKYLEWLLGADHLGPYTTEGPAEQAVAAVSIAFFDTYLRQMAPSVTQVATIGQVSGVATEEADVDGS